MNYWEGPARWINAILLVIVSFVGLDTLFRLLDARLENVIVRFVRRGADFFLAPFDGMFENQEFLLTAIIAVLGYSLLAGIALAVLRSVQASRRRAARRDNPPRHEHPRDDGPTILTEREARERGDDADTRRL